MENQYCKKKKLSRDQFSQHTLSSPKGLAQEKFAEIITFQDEQQWFSIQYSLLGGMDCWKVWIILKHFPALMIKKEFR